MDKDTIVVGKIKTPLSRWSKIISKDFCKAKRQLIKEILYGIQATKDVELSNINRSLHEEQALIKTKGRLSRNLDVVNFSEVLNEQIFRLGAFKVLYDMVIALDPSDISKEQTRTMEYLCRTRDGSVNELGDGYWICKAVAADVEHKQVIPLYREGVLLGNGGPLEWEWSIIAGHWQRGL